MNFNKVFMISQGIPTAALEWLHVIKAIRWTALASQKIGLILGGGLVSLMLNEYIFSFLFLKFVFLFN